MSKQEQRRAWVVSRVMAGELGVAEAARLLQLSERSIRRLRARMEREGPAALVHGNRGRVSPRRLSEATRALARTTDAASASLRVAGWTTSDWAFRFEVPSRARHVVVHVPHDGSPPRVRDAGAGPDPLTPGDLRRS